MPRNRRVKGSNPLKESNQTVHNSVHSKGPVKGDNVNEQSKVYPTGSFGSAAGALLALDNENNQPCTLSSTFECLNTSTAALYDELDSFRQKWRRELGHENDSKDNTRSSNSDPQPSTSCNSVSNNLLKDTDQVSKFNSESEKENSDSNYAKAVKLFLTAVQLEQDDLHHESIRYYKQAIHLYPDIEKQIFRDQCEQSARESARTNEINEHKQVPGDHGCDGINVERVPLREKILKNYLEELGDQHYVHCRPSSKVKPGTIHLSDLPHELMLHIFRYVIGQELDLASLELAGLVCRGFYLLSKDQSLWKNICEATWKCDLKSWNEDEEELINHDWIEIFSNRTRVNFDGVYISRTRYIRQGDVGFQDITYRPFHVVRYYRYLRFFPDHKVLILTTNEDPERIIPIFRHATSCKHFSPELSILQGTFEFLGPNKIEITADKDCRAYLTQIQNHRRHTSSNCSRQTPLSQRFNLKFELKTYESKPYKNNVLKWLEYSITTRLETGQEITSFDLSPDTFPNLNFSRVKKFNLRLTKPLSSQ